MKLIRAMMFAVTLSLSFACAAKADPFSTISITYQLTGADSSQLGRPSRNSNPQTYAGNELYPGQINTASTYYYQTFTLAASDFAGAPYVEISTYDPINGSSYFLSAYQNSYDPIFNSSTDDHRRNNWLGDVGFSGNFQTNDGGDMEVLLPAGSDLVLLLNSTGTNGALPTYPFTINVQAYSDANFGDPIAATPEPSSLILAGTGLIGMVGAFVRRRFV